jgi:hypothetical protein
MSIAAKLAQGSKFYIASTAGGAKTITAATPGFPTILTSAAHGLANGDVVAIAAITGTLGTDATNGLNGKTLVVTNVTANTFCVNVNTLILTYTSGGTATPSTWTQIKEVKGFKPSGASADKIDVTDLDSTAKEFLTGLVDNGTFSSDINYLSSDAGQTALLAAFNGSLSKNYKLQVLGGNSFTFAASVTKFPTMPDGAVGTALTGSVEFQISGAVTVA